MGSYVLLGGSIVVGLALMTDPSQTIKLSTAIITIRGVTFIAKRITHTINKDYGEIIDFAGWCIAGLAIVPLIKLSTTGATTISASIDKFKNTITGIGMYFEKFAEIVDKLTFWD